ncbi:cupin domain-containing protein [Kitasatospora sp. NPDC097605]|uniref:JmjC domain-containing protein n=1 Tax=Kitasatospora sp. NPDC097605 TaxID=3157226 RepID=UPI00332641E2
MTTGDPAVLTTDTNRPPLSRAARWPFLADLPRLLAAHDRNRPQHHPGLLQPDSLFGWDALNTILGHQHLEPPQLQLAKDGRYLPADTYTRPVTLRPGVTQHRIDPAAFYERLTAGATLVLDAVDHLHPGLHHFAAGLEAQLRTNVTVSAYASIQPDPSFGQHWDDHAVLVLQLAGTKRWTIHGPTLPNPTAATRSLAPRPDGDEELDLTLRPGDALYVPRGWWHLVSASNGPSLHLTCGLTPHTGLDLITWLASDPDLSALRADLPAAGDQDTADYLQALHTQLGEALRDPAVVRRFTAAADRAAPVRTALSLPHIVPSIPLDPATPVTLLATRLRTNITPTGQTQLHANGIGYEPPALLVRIIEPLKKRDSATIAELADAAQIPLARTAQLTALLIRQGLVALADQP